MDRQVPDINANQVLGLIAAFTAGALAMYYLDSTMGGRRRALARDKVIGATHDAAEFVQHKGKHMADRAKGMMATRNLDRVTSTEPQTDAQLRERVQSRMGHLVSHPRAIEVSVQDGIVRLSGQVLAKELDGLLSQIAGMAGVRKVHNALAALDDPSGFGEVPRQERAQATPES